MQCTVCNIFCVNIDTNKKYSPHYVNCNINLFTSILSSSYSTLQSISLCTPPISIVMRGSLLLTHLFCPYEFFNILPSIPGSSSIPFSCSLSPLSIFFSYCFLNIQLNSLPTATLKAQFIQLCPLVLFRIHLFHFFSCKHIPNIDRSIFLCEILTISTLVFVRTHVSEA